MKVDCSPLCTPAIGIRMILKMTKSPTGSFYKDPPGIFVCFTLYRSASKGIGKKRKRQTGKTLSLYPYFPVPYSPVIASAVGRYQKVNGMSVNAGILHLTLTEPFNLYYRSHRNYGSICRNCPSGIHRCTGGGGAGIAAVALGTRAVCGNLKGTEAYPAVGRRFRFVIVIPFVGAAAGRTTSRRAAA